MASIINGTPWADTLTGSFESDYIYGNDGADWILGGSGNDVLYGGNGRDTLDGGAGQDSLFGGAGDDILVYDPDDQLLQGNEGLDLLLAGPLMSSVTISLAGFSDIENLIADGSNVTLLGNTGDNILAGQGPGDSIDGGSGNDLLYAAGGTAALNGGLGNDIIVFNPDNNPANVQGGAGQDELDASRMEEGAAIALADYIYNDIEIVIGGYGADTLTGNAFANTLLGGDSDDLVNGLAGNDLLYGGRGDDTLSGGTDNDTLAGGNGIDYYTWGLGSGNDAIKASNLNGQDSIILEPGISAADLKFLNSGNDYAISLRDSSAGKLTIQGWKSGSDYQIGQIIAGAETATFAGGFWRSVLTGSDTAADDTLYGAEGNTAITGLENNDVIQGYGGADTIDGGAGNDTILYYSGLAHVDGGDGNDVLTAAAATAGAAINPAAGTAYSSLEMVIGSAWNDTLTGWVGNNDTLDGGGGNDLLLASTGADTFLFGADEGNDTLRGIDDSDWICFDAGSTSANLFAYKTAHNDLVIASADSMDVLTIENYNFASGVFPHFAQGNGVEILLAETASGYYSFGGLDHNFATMNADAVFAANDNGTALHGLGGNDTITGGKGGDTLYGDPGNDYLTGGRANDLEQGNNLLYGGDGNDTLVGGRGNDTLYGEAGKDDYTLWNGCGQMAIGANASNDKDRLVIRDSERTFAGITFNNFFINTTDDQPGHSPEAVMAGNDLWLDFSMYGTLVLAGYGNSAAGYHLQTVRIHNDTGGGLSFEGKLGIGTAADDSLPLSADTDNMFFGLGGNDTITGGNRQNYLVGGGGDDALAGGANSTRNILLGGTGNDSLAGGGSFDILVGGDGNDTLAGGSIGYDVYRFASGWGHDVIVDLANTSINNSVDFTDLKLSDIENNITISGTTMTITYGDDVLQITGGFENYAFRFDIAENGYNKYIYSNGKFNGL